jgi:hypothetical protein
LDSLASPELCSRRNGSPGRAKEKEIASIFRPFRARQFAARYRGFPSLPLADRFTPGYASCARFAAAFTQIDASISQMYKRRDVHLSGKERGQFTVFAESYLSPNRFNSAWLKTILAAASL